ncbi:unnamed protein product [Closterium sp. NIES-54]
MGDGTDSGRPSKLTKPEEGKADTLPPADGAGDAPERWAAEAALPAVQVGKGCCWETGGGAAAVVGRAAAGDVGAAVRVEKGEAAAHTAVTLAADSQAAAAGEGQGPGVPGWRRKAHRGERNELQGEWGVG